MRNYQWVLYLGATALLTSCGISSTPTRALTGAAGDAVATAQRDALGLGDMAIQDSDNLPNLTLQTGKTLSLLGNNSQLSVGGATSLLGTLNVSGLTTLQGLGAQASTMSSLSINGGVLGVPDGKLAVQGDASVSGDMVVGDLAALNRLQVTTTSTLDGNTTVGGTLGVTGASTLTGNTSVGGTLTVAALKDSAAPTLKNGILSVTGSSGLIGRTDITAGFLKGATTSNGTLSFSTIAQGDVTNLTGDLAAKAPLVSPSFSGGVTAAGGLTLSSGNLSISGGNIVLDGSAARTISSNRSSLDGNDLTLQAGGGVSNGTDQNGGKLILSGGISTGSGSSSIEFHTATAAGTGTTDRTPTKKMTLDGAGNLALDPGGLLLKPAALGSCTSGLNGLVKLSTTYRLCVCNKDGGGANIPAWWNTATGAVDGTNCP